MYHFINECYGLDDIRRCRLKVSTISELNDPFELLGVNLSNSDVRHAFLEVRRTLSSNRGMLCFSRNWRNPVQWSHYADRHRGLCLGFDIPDEYLIHVSYQSTRLPFDPTRFGDTGTVGQAAIQEVLSTKYCHWRYEQEVRVFVSLDEREGDSNWYFKSFSEDLALREVIVGCNSELSKSALLSALGDTASKVDICKARPAFRTFRIVKQNNKVLWP
ncbi:DUF2971 domain-containing protein [Dongia sp.]|uniref:DUF2971 domain-containing protein n=1 Tax=Dongia sp. TaxID=1977262 RepID=UPI0035B3B2CE